MKSSIERADQRAYAVINLIASAVHKATGVSADELKSKSCAHRVTKARFIFADLCNGIVAPAPLIAEYLDKNAGMISYYKRSHNECYGLYSEFREMSDEANKMLVELLTKTNGTFNNVFQEEGEQVQC